MKISFIFYKTNSHIRGKTAEFSGVQIFYPLDTGEPNSSQPQKG